MNMKNEVKNMILMGNNILIKPEKVVEDGRTEAGIIIKKTGIERTPKWGEVIKVSSEINNIKKGDMVLLWGITVGDIELDGEKYMMAMADKLLAVIPKEKV